MAQQSTPESFASLPPVLRYHLDRVRIYLSPTPANPPSCFSKHTVTSSFIHQDEDEEPQDVSVAEGALWLTEQ